jgi:ribonuclease Z
MDLDVVFLGTGGSVPSARRNTAGVLVRRGGDRILFDCGEGTQRQMQRSVGLIPVDDIFVTHLHADHYLGLPGLIKSYEMQDRSEPLAIHGPPGLVALFDALRRVIGRPRYPIELVELNRGETVERDGYAIEPFDVEHRVVANGYALFEHARPGRFDPEAARELGVEPGPAFSALQRGEEVPGSAGPVRPDQVMGADRPGRKVVVTGDTEPCETTRIAAHDADLLVHDSSFAAEEADRAAETGHSTAREAAEVAADAGVRMLALVHISSRHFVPDILAEAREVFPAAVAPRDFDLVDLPLPERGEPRLVENGARKPPGDRAEPEPA